MYGFSIKLEKPDFKPILAQIVWKTPEQDFFKKSDSDSLLFKVR